MKKFTGDNDVRVRHAKAVLTQLEAAPEAAAHAPLPALEEAVWREVDCLQCANCCRTMWPVFTPADAKRIATHLRLSVPRFRQKYLEKTAGAQWMMRSSPCAFLDLATNKCAVYAVRPADCAGFPHLQKTPLAQFANMHRQNASRCPATLRFIEKVASTVQAGNGGMGF